MPGGSTKLMHAVRLMFRGVDWKCRTWKCGTTETGWENGGQAAESDYI